jgi:hypothetical protein
MAYTDCGCDGLTTAARDKDNAARFKLWQEQPGNNLLSIKFGSLHNTLNNNNNSFHRPFNDVMVNSSFELISF